MISMIRPPFFIYKSLYIESLQPVGIPCTKLVSGSLNLSFVLVNPALCQNLKLHAKFKCVKDKTLGSGHLSYQFVITIDI